MDTYYHTRVTIYRMHTAKGEPRFKLQAVGDDRSMHVHRLQQSTALVGDVDSEGGYACWEQEVCANSGLPVQFCCELQIVLNIVYFFLKKADWHDTQNKCTL